jgi:hypothetical protein
MSVLAERQCVPCRRGVPPLTDDELAPLLAQIDRAWTVEIGDDGKAADENLFAGGLPGAYPGLGLHPMPGM